MSALRIIGVDQSLSATGIAVYHRDSPTSAPWMATQTVTTADHLPFERRMQIILGRLWTVCGNGTAGGLNVLVALEEPFVADPRKRSGSTTLKLGGVMYLIRYGLYARDIPFAVVHNTKLKMYATGAGNAGKPVVTEAANYHLRNLTQAMDDNQGDAMWLAAMAAHHYLGEPLHHSRPAHALATPLAEVSWPQWTPWPDNREEDR